MPETFRFAVKVPKTITHTSRLRDVGARLDAFLGETIGLASKLGCLLVQLPPSLAFEAAVVDAFFTALRARYAGPVACEPRHATWFASDAVAVLVAHRVARVAADPARVPEAAEPGGWPGLLYLRLHGSPRTYYSSYDDATLAAVAARLAAASGTGTPAWCIFDNTTLGAATPNALDVRRRLAHISAEAGR